MTPYKAVAVALNSKYVHSSLAPWCLAAGVRTYCRSEVSCQVVEGTINEPSEAVWKRIAAFAPQLVGLSCYIWNIDQTRALIETLRCCLPQIVIVVGGPEVSYCAEMFLKENPAVDGVLSGEGEFPFARLCDTLASSGDWSGVPGLSFRREDGTLQLSEPWISNEDPPDPYTEEYFAALNGRIAYLETSRGCPFGCAFCLSGRCGSVRWFSIDQAKKNILRLASSSARTVKLVDRTFNANAARAKELLRFILDHYGSDIPKGVCFHFEMAGDLMDGELISLLGSAPSGSIQLEIGLQSFHTPTLAAIRRKTDSEKLKSNIRALLSFGSVHVHIDLIAGLPEEDWSAFRESFNAAFALSPHMLQLGFLKLLYGAPMREEPERFPCSYHSAPPYEVQSTPWMSQDELRRLHALEDALERLYNSGRFRRTLCYLLQATGQLPFDLLLDFGEAAAERGTQGISLDDYAAFVYQWFSQLPGVSQLRLRDEMVCDRIATNSVGRLPQFLRREDPRLLQLKKLLQNDPMRRQQPGIKRSFAVLAERGCGIYADYLQKNPVTGEYPLYEVEL